LPDTEGGLYLEAEQLAKIGHLYMHDGVWDGRRILPEGWVREATSRIVEGTNGTTNGYGYQWWRLDRRGVDIWAGQGFGGQYLIVIPSLGIVAVSNAWNIWGNRVSGLLPVLLNTLIDAAG
jgi:CubicO group peptidase (beta-lactamase class C family)